MYGDRADPIDRVAYAVNGTAHGGFGELRGNTTMENAVWDSCKLGGFSCLVILNG